MFFGWQQPQSDQLLSSLHKHAGPWSTLPLSGHSKLWPLQSFWLFSFCLLFLSCYPGAPFPSCSSVQGCQSLSPQHAAGQFALLVFLLGDLLNMILQNLKGNHSKWPGLGLESAASLKTNLPFTELLLDYISRCGHWIYIAGQFSLFYWKLPKGWKAWRCENSA